MKLKFLGALACLSSFIAGEAHTVPKLVNTGAAIYLDFQDGRKAVLTHALSKVFSSHLSLRQIENTCDSGQILANCKINFEMASRSQSLRWAIHPDPSKVGAIVKVKVPENSTVLQSNDITENTGPYFWTNNTSNPPWPNYFRPDVIVCDQYDWTKQLQKVNGHFLIQSWTGEVMLTNPETGVNENQTFGGGYNIELEKTATNSLVFNSFGKLNTTGLPFYFSDQVTTMTFLNTNNRQCQIAFEVNLQDFIRNIQDPHFNEPDLTTQVPMTQTSDFVRFGFVPSIIRQLLQAKTPIEVE